MNHTPRSAILYSVGIMTTMVMFVALAINLGPSVQAMVGDSLSDALSSLFSAFAKLVNYATSLNVAMAMSAITFIAGCTCLLMQYFLRNNDIKADQKCKLTINTCYFWMMGNAICWSMLITFRSASAGDFESNFFIGMLAAIVSFFALVCGTIWGEITAKKYQR